MRKSAILIAAGAAALSACATTTAPRAGFCNAGPAQAFVGQRADAAAGLAIRQATGSDTVRWAPPDAALTMDFREGRVTVHYDQDMTITRLACG